MRSQFLLSMSAFLLVSSFQAVRSEDAKVVRSVSAERRTALDHASLVDQLAREHALLWQKAAATYRESERKLRKAILVRDFAEARRLLNSARQTVESNRRYATPASEYDALQRQLKDVEAFVNDEQRKHNERLIRDRLREVQNQESERLASVRQSKERQIAQFMDRATELRKERRFDEAIQVLDQVLAINPNHDQAKWMQETLEDLAVNIRDRQAVRNRHREAQGLFVETDEAGIPWNEDMTYPGNWREITARRTGTAEATEPVENRRVRKRLQRVAPEIKFDTETFESVIDRIRAMTGLNIVPNWNALEAAAIEKDAEVTLRLQNVKLEKALELILTEVGAGEVDLAYEIDDGVITISTKDDLSRRTVTSVHNIEDLLISVPTFRGRRINLQNIGQNQGQIGGLGGGRFISGGGGGAGGGNQGGGLFQGGGGNDDDDNIAQTNPIGPIITLIQGTIDPASWRQAGGNVGSVSALNQQLIVTQTSTAQTELRDLLREESNTPHQSVQ